MKRLLWLALAPLFVSCSDVTPDVENRLARQKAALEHVRNHDDPLAFLRREQGLRVLDENDPLANQVLIHVDQISEDPTTLAGAHPLESLWRRSWFELGIFYIPNRFFIPFIPINSGINPNTEGGTLIIDDSHSGSMLAFGLASHYAFVEIQEQFDINPNEAWSEIQSNRRNAYSIHRELAQDHNDTITADEADRRSIKRNRWLQLHLLSELQTLHFFDKTYAGYYTAAKQTGHDRFARELAQSFLTLLPLIGDQRLQELAEFFANRTSSLKSLHAVVTETREKMRKRWEPRAKKLN